MTLAPRFLVKLWTRILVASFGRRLRVPGGAIRAQHRAFASLVSAAAATEFGRSLGLGAATSYAQFREKVPLQTYDGIEPLVARMAAGEADVLVPGQCRFFVRTAGTAGPRPKVLPAPDAMLAHYRHALGEALFHHAQRIGHPGVFLGRHVQVGASTALTEAKGAQRTSLDGILTLCLTPWDRANLHSPPATIAELAEGTEKVAAIARAMLGGNVTLVAGTPAALCALAQAVRDAAGPTPPPFSPLKAAWPNLECCCHTGAPAGLFGDALRAAVGPGVNLHEVYAAAEGIFAAQDGDKPAALRLLAGSGVFFEFLPLASYNEATVSRAGSFCVPVEKVQAGTDYVPVVTTPAGLCRYATGDIVRFVSVDPPRLQFIGRAAFQLNSLGERVDERDVTETLQAVCLRNGWQPISFHVAPFTQRLGPGQVAHVHEWWLELQTHSVKTPTANVLGPELDAELRRRNADYAIRREQKVLGEPQVRLVMPGVFERWAQEQRMTASASKLPRCRPDRVIADQLAALAPFHQPAIVPLSTTTTQP